MTDGRENKIIIISLAMLVQAYFNATKYFFSLEEHSDARVRSLLNPLHIAPRTWSSIHTDADLH